MDADVEGYDSEAREALQDWAKANRERVDQVCVLYHSSLVEMGASLASAFTSGLIHGVGDAQEFERSSARAVEVHGGDGLDPRASRG